MQDLKDLQERMVLQDPGDHQVPKGRGETKALRDPLGETVFLAHEDCLAPLVLWVSRERMVIKARLDHRAKKASRAARESRAHQVHQVPGVSEERRELLVPLENVGLLDEWVVLAEKEKMVH